jgi:hypothetical protein
MPSPSSALSSLRTDLSASMEEFDLLMDAEGFIGQRVLAAQDVGKKSSTFGKIPIEQLLQAKETKRAPGASYGRGNWKFEEASYSCEEHGWEEPVDDNEREMYIDFFDAEVVAMNRAQRIIAENQEKRIAAMIFNATTYTSQSTAVTTEWSNAASATPISDIEAAVQACWGRSGLWPNAMVINRKVFRNLRNCAQIVDRLKYQGFQDVRASSITVQALAQVFDIPNLLVAGGAKNTANEGATASISSIWSDEYCWIGRIAETQDFREPCVGRLFHWAQDGSELRGRVEEYRDETVRSNIIRVRHQVDEVELHTACNQLLSNITA